MNAANVMAISPKAGAASKVQGTRMAGKVNKASANAPQGSFDEALGKAGEEVTGKMAKSPTEAQGSIPGNVDAKEADIKDDMPEGTDAALNGQQGREPKSGKTSREWGKHSQVAKVRDGENDTAGEQETDTLNTQAVALNFTTEGKAVLTVDEQSQPAKTAPLTAVELNQPAKTAPLTAVELNQQTKASSEVNLQSLLPQSGKDVQKNKNFLAMLSGQQVKLNAETVEETSSINVIQGQETADLVQQQVRADQGIGPLTKPATLLEAQLNTHQLANMAGYREDGVVPQQDLPLRNLQESNPAQARNPDWPDVPLANQVVWQNEGGKAPLLTNQPVLQVSAQENLQFAYPQEQSVIQTESQVSGQISAEDMPQEPWQAQDNLNNLQFAILNNGKDRQETKGMAPFEQSEEMMPSMPAGRVNDSVILQKAGQVLVPEEVVRTSSVRKNDTVTVNNPLAGVSVTVEDVVPVTDNAMDMQENLQQNLYRQNQPKFSETKLVANEEGEMVSQLVEEAVGDKVPPQTEPARVVHNESISAFQQSLDENLTGAKMSAEVNQTQNMQEDFDVPKQIVEQARLLRRGEDTQMVIKLHPDHLGELTLKVSVSANGAVNASFHSDNAQVRAIIENTLVQLKQELNNQGLKVDNVDVYAGLTDGHLPQGEGQQSWQQNQRHNSNGSIRNLGDVADYGEETENIAVGVQGTAEAADGVDYRV